MTYHYHQVQNTTNIRETGGYEGEIIHALVEHSSTYSIASFKLNLCITIITLKIYIYLSSQATCTQLSSPKPIADAPPLME